MELLNARDLFEGKFKPATEEDILKLERELDCTLPQDYKDLTLHYSGFFVGASCRIKNELLAEALNVGDVVDVDIFFGAQATNHPYRIAEYYNRFKEPVPPGFLPIASNSSGDLICLSVGAENPGSIYYWYLDKEWDNDDNERKEASYSNVYLLASCFDEFIDALFKD